MKNAALRGVWVTLCGLAVVQLGGCSTGVEPLQYVAGSTGQATVLSGEAAVNVLTPVASQSITGGTQVEVNWQAFATSRTSVINIIIDKDQDPTNGNETLAYTNLPLTQDSTLIDTSQLERGTYYLGVLLVAVGEIKAAGYAPGTITIDQRPTLFYNQTADLSVNPPVYSARENLGFDRTDAIVPRFNVSWDMCDPDSTNTVEIFLDPDESPDGNEILLYHSDKPQDPNGCASDQFTFDLPTTLFPAGTYHILAVVSDGQNSFPFYAPGSIRLRTRLAGNKDLRDLDLPTSPIAGAVFEGFNPRDNAGSFVSSISDIDGDGFDDFLIMSQFGKPRYIFSTQSTGIGEAYLVYGRPDAFSGRINLNSTGTLFRGEIYEGAPETSDPIRPSRGITSFALLSDWDRDGVREMAFGLPFTDSISIGGFVITSGGGHPAPLDVNGYFRTGGVVIAAGSSLRPDIGFPGRNVFNLAEFGTLAHMPFSDPPECPEGFYGPKAPPPINGGATYFHQHLYTRAGAALNIGAVRLGCRFSSLEFGDQFGETVSAWDFDSIIMSAPNRDPLTSTLQATVSVPGGGVVSVFYDDVKDGFYPWTNAESPAANTATGYVGTVQSSGDRFLPHGGPYHYIIDAIDPASKTGRGPGYLVDLADGTPPCVRFTFDTHIATPDRSVRFWSDMPGARLSNAKAIGDLNADGLVDMVVGAPLAHDGAGACYVILGRLRDVIMGGELQVEQLARPMNAGDPLGARIFDGIQIVGSPGERFGQSQDDAGDFNHDGFADVVLGSPLLNNHKGGAAVFFGSRDVINLTQTEIPMIEFPARGLGVIFTGEDDGDLAGARVAGAGDIDGDGFSDILIAAPSRSIRLDLNGDGVLDIDRQECGVVYLIYGGPDLMSHRTPGGAPGVLSLQYVGTSDLPGVVFIGRNSGDHLGAGLGLQGDRSFGIASAGDVNGDGKRDLLLGSVDASPRERVKAGETYLIYGLGD